MPASSSLFRTTALAALVALGATAAHAQSSVSVYGLIDLSMGQSQAPGAKATKNVNSGNMSTSFIGFKGSEDLGGGLKANFQLEQRLDLDTGAQQPTKANGVDVPGFTVA